MKILYVTGMGIPLRDILSGKQVEEVTHSPGFFQPWRRLAQRGHQVDFVVTSNFDTTGLTDEDIAVDWFSLDNLKANIYDPAVEMPLWKRLPRQFGRLFRLAFHVNKALRKEDYDFVICWAFVEGLVGNIFANLYKVPSGTRCMGTLLVPALRERGALGTALRHPVEFMSFKLRKKYLLMTDDGTNGDELYEAWRPAPGTYDFLFWKTGVKFRTVADIIDDFDVSDGDYLFYAARFDPWKRHDLAVKTLRALHEQGRPLQLYFAGSIHSPSYFDRIMRQAREAGLGDHVHHLGSIPGDHLRVLAYYATANLFMYDVSNLGNVFFETYTTGGAIVGKNDGSLDDYIDHGRNGFLVADSEGAARVIDDLLSGAHDVEAIRSAAIADSRARCMSMDERFDAEVDLIERIGRTGETGLLLDQNGIHCFDSSGVARAPDSWQSITSRPPKLSGGSR